MNDDKINVMPFGFTLETVGIILGIIFTTLKGCNIGIFASWSWFWVTFPFWIVIASTIAIEILIILITIIIALITGDK